MDQICRHPRVEVEPTLETAWGLEDRYSARCEICKTLVHEKESRYDLWYKIQTENREVGRGKQYL